MLEISRNVKIPLDEIDIEFVRAQGAGGQNVNKSSTAAHLRFDIRASSLPDFYKYRLLKLTDQRITDEGIIVIKGQQHRSRERNRADALERLQELIQRAGVIRKKRHATRPTRAAKQRRLDSKKRRGQAKSLRGKVDY